MPSARLRLPDLFGSTLAGVSLAWAPLDALAADAESLLAELSEPERARAERFHFERDRARYVAARAVLRGLLGAAIGRPAGELRLVEDAWGKPRLDGEGELAFNLSHAGDRALYAFGRGVALGVDVEALAPLAGMADLAGDVFAPAELQEWQALAPDERIAGFFNGWTRKEAFVKALGRGLDYPLGSFAVSLSPGRAAAFLSLPEDAAPASDWRIEALTPEPGYVAAVVARTWRAG